MAPLSIRLWPGGVYDRTPSDAVSGDLMAHRLTLKPMSASFDANYQLVKDRALNL